jgi:hypothetical protein
LTLPSITNSQRQLIHAWSPVAVAGLIAAAAFIALGQTTIVGITLTLQRFGNVLAITGGLALAFSPAFWSQTGGSDSSLALVAAALVVAGTAAALTGWFGRKTALGLAVGVVVFAALFSVLVGTPRSLRLTTLLTAWLLYLLIDGLLAANPRPDGPPPAPLKPHHTFGILLLLAVGVFNDPLFTLLTPAIALGLLLARTPLPRWYWLALSLIVIVGLRALALQYVMDSGWWGASAERAQGLGIRGAFVIADGWHTASRWLYLFNLVIGQFTLFGVILGVFGLARLARWYPPLGSVTMVAYAAYALFGLVYFGRDSAVLLLPLLMIQVIWMTYAVHSLGHWLQKSFQASGAIGWFAPAAFMLLPLLMLLRITGSG